MSIFKSRDFQNILGQPSGKKGFRVHIDDDFAAEKFSRALSETLTNLITDSNQEVVIMCIGTDRSTGDCLGPLVGTKLNENPLNHFTVYGTLDDPVHASNLNEKLLDLKQNFANPFVVAVDACLGQLDSVGLVSIATGALQPGAGVNKSLPEVGELHITGVVNVGGFMEFIVLQNTRLSIVMKMANIISRAIVLAGHTIRGKKSACRND